MKINEYLTQSLRKFSLLDFILVRWTYFIFALFIAKMYPTLIYINPYFYFMISLISAFPLILIMKSYEGKLHHRSLIYVKNNNPCRQALTFISVFFFGLTVCSVFPIMGNFSPLLYIILILIFAIKPIKKSLFW